MIERNRAAALAVVKAVARIEELCRLEPFGVKQGRKRIANVREHFEIHIGFAEPAGHDVESTGKGCGKLFVVANGRSAAQDKDVGQRIEGDNTATRHFAGNEARFGSGSRVAVAGIDDAIGKCRFRGAIFIGGDGLLAGALPAERDAAMRIAERGSSRVTDGLRNERRLVVQADDRTAHGKGSAGAGDGAFVLQAGRFHRILGPAVFHQHVGLELVSIAQGLEDLDGPQTIKRERLIRRDRAAHAGAKPGAKLGAFINFHSNFGGLPRLFIAAPDLHVAGNFDDRHF